MATELPAGHPLRKLASREPLYAAMAVKLVVDLAAYAAKRWLGLDLPTEAMAAWFVATLGVATVAARQTVWAPASVERYAADARREGAALAAQAPAVAAVVKRVDPSEEQLTRARQEGAIMAVRALEQNNLEVVVGPPSGKHSARPPIDPEAQGEPRIVPWRKP